LYEWEEGDSKKKNNKRHKSTKTPCAKCKHICNGQNALPLPTRPKKYQQKKKSIAETTKHPS